MPSKGQRASRRQEERLADRIGGRRVSGSGNGWAVKNDVRNRTISVEAKITTKKSYSLKEDDLLQAERHALLDSGREFAFVVQMAGGREWVVISREFAEGLGVFGGTSDQA